MEKTNLTENDIRLLIEENKKNVPVSSLFWKINISQNDDKTNFFEFFSKKHYSDKMRPVNFYKPLITVVNFDE